MRKHHEAFDFGGVGRSGLGDAVRRGEGRRQSEVPVTLVTNSSGQVTRAYGIIGTARNSADTKQLIGCFIGAAGSSLQAGCEAQSAAGANTMCLSSNAGVIAAVQAVEPD